MSLFLDAGYGDAVNYRAMLRPICWFFGHKRGKPVDRRGDFASGPPGLMAERTHQTYACPRCGRETRYKIKPKAAPEGA